MKVISLFDRASRQWDMGNLREAFKLFLEASAGGDTSAFSNLGFFYDQGLGTPVDKKAACLWYKRAARQGEMAGAYNLALWYFENGNPRQGKHWLIKLIDRGDGDAALYLAKWYMKKTDLRSRRLAANFLGHALKAKHATPETREDARSLKKILTESTKQ